MDYKRLTLAAVVAWVVDMAYGFVVWGIMLNDHFALYPAVFRSEAEMGALMPLMFVGGLIGMFALAYIYARGYEGRGALAEGFRFGLVMAVFITAFVSVGIYASFNIGAGLGVLGAAASFIEFTLVGTTIGLLYRPAAEAAVARATA